MAKKLTSKYTTNELRCLAHDAFMIDWRTATRQRLIAWLRRQGCPGV